MGPMLKYRLLFGTLIAAFLCALVIAGAWWDGSLTPSPDDDSPVSVDFPSGSLSEVVF